jgi:hypothetical protein
MFLGRLKQAMFDWNRPFRVETTGSPLWHPAIQSLTYCQNVAGLWLKYGAKSPIIGTSWACKILTSDVMIC